MCEHLGFPHPDYLLPLLTAEQFADWLEYEGITGPLGHARDDIHYGQIASVSYNSMLSKSSKALSPTDFMPYHEEPPKTQAELEAAILSTFGR